MFNTVLFLAIALTSVTAQDNRHGHGHGPAYSSQSIVLHHSHVPAHQETHQQQEEIQHGHQVEQYLGHHSEQHHGQQQELHGHHGVSSQNIHLFNDGHVTKHEEYYGHPKYDFSYEVKDPHTHDHKYQHETRDGDVVKGEYLLHQPDGTIRIVKYHADKKSGFNADVKYEGHAVHVVSKPNDHH